MINLSPMRAQSSNQGGVHGDCARIGFLKFPCTDSLQMSFRENEPRSTVFLV